MKKPAAIEAIITGRLLVLQSKRLLLSSALRRLDRTPNRARRRRAERLRSDIDSAQSTYRSTILNFESPESHEYWLVAYGRLIDMGGGLVARLRGAVPDLPLDERLAASTDLEKLEAIVRGWTESMRESMTAASRAVA
jgi:hypothetical protein